MAWRRLVRGKRSRSWSRSWARFPWRSFSDCSLLYSPLLYYAAPGYGYAPAPAVPTTWYWCDPYAILSVCGELPDCMAANSTIRLDRAVASATNRFYGSQCKNFRGYRTCSTPTWLTAILLNCENLNSGAFVAADLCGDRQTLVCTAVHHHQRIHRLRCYGIA
jgi:hypothetical protein